MPVWRESQTVNLMLLRIFVMRRAQRLGLVVCACGSVGRSHVKGVKRLPITGSNHTKTQRLSLGPWQNLDDDIM